METTEKLIINNILKNEDFTRKVLPFIQPNYFQGASKKLFLQIAKFVAKYNKIPTKDAITIELENNDKLNEDEFREIVSNLPAVFKEPEKVDEDWLIDTTEKWCQDRALYNAVMESISIIDGKHKEKNKDALPDLLSKALAVSFDTNIGHDYLEDFAERWESYHREEEKIPFDIELLNKITRGGLSKKTLNILLAGCVHPDTKVRVRIQRKTN